MKTIPVHGNTTLCLDLKMNQKNKPLSKYLQHFIQPISYFLCILQIILLCLIFRRKLPTVNPEQMIDFSVLLLYTLSTREHIFY